MSPKATTAPPKSGCLRAQEGKARIPAIKLPRCLQAFLGSCPAGTNTRLCVRKELPWVRSLRTFRRCPCRRRAGTAARSHLRVPWLRAASPAPASCPRVLPQQGFLHGHVPPATSRGALLQVWHTFGCHSAVGELLHAPSLNVAVSSWSCSSSCSPQPTSGSHHHYFSSL